MFHRLEIKNPPPENYLDYLEWRSLKLRGAFEAHPTKANFTEWKRWEKIFKQAMVDDEYPAANITRIQDDQRKFNAEREKVVRRANMVFFSNVDNPFKW